MKVSVKSAISTQNVWSIFASRISDSVNPDKSCLQTM